MSNKTPAENAKKTKSARRFIFPVVCFVVLFGSIVGMYSMQRPPERPERVRIGETTLRITDVFTTPETRQQGLSGRQTLAADEAVLFVFDEPTGQCFWMKDMNFAIDMVWLDARREVVHVVTAAEPESYPGTFCPGSEARYVLETAAGKSGASVGQRAVLQ